MSYWIYIMASGIGGTLYVGVTNDLRRRGFEHREGIIAGFTKRHAVNRLVYYEEFADVLEAIAREKRIKKWPRQWKINLIEKSNPHWVDLYPSIAW